MHVKDRLQLRHNIQKLPTKVFFNPYDHQNKYVVLQFFSDARVFGFEQRTFEPNMHILEENYVCNVYKRNSQDPSAYSDIWVL